MSTVSENYTRGAQMARQLADEYRREAKETSTPPVLREKWLDAARRADDRADWYEEHAEMYHGKN